MQYLVLRRFRTMGVWLMKGSVVDESVIKSPRIRQSEGKIIPAVSSLEVPKEMETEESISDGASSDIKLPDEDQEIDKEPVKPLFTFSNK